MSTKAPTTHKFLCETEDSMTALGEGREALSAVLNSMHEDIFKVLEERAPASVPQFKALVFVVGAVIDAMDAAKADWQRMHDAHIAAADAKREGRSNG